MRGSTYRHVFFGDNSYKESQLLMVLNNQDGVVQGFQLPRKSHIWNQKESQSFGALVAVHYECPYCMFLSSGLKSHLDVSHNISFYIDVNAWDVPCAIFVYVLTTFHDWSCDVASYTPDCVLYDQDRAFDELIFPLYDADSIFAVSLDYHLQCILLASSFPAMLTVKNLVEFEVFLYGFAAEEAVADLSLCTINYEGSSKSFSSIYPKERVCYA